MEKDLNSAIQNKNFFKENSNRPYLWAVGSGKGGVGKTFVASSLAITLSKLGHTVTVVDLDTGGANIHTAFGVGPSHVGLRDFFEGSRDLKSCVTVTPLLSVSFIQGFWDTWVPTELAVSQVSLLLEECKKLECDYVIFDLGPGAVESHLEIFKIADERFLITTPEPTSIEKTYRFLEAFICYGLKENSIPEVYEKLIKSLREYRREGFQKNFSFKDFLNQNEGVNKLFFNHICSNPVRLLLNSSRSQANYDLGFSIQSVCNKYYDLSLDYIGGLDYDNAVWQSVRNREAALIAQPFTPLAGQFLSICKQLIDPEELRAVI